MQQVTEFIVGERYSNDQIRFTLGVSNLGGIRPSLDPSGQLRHVVIMTSEPGKQSHQDNPYQDRIENDILVFTGSGRKGQQELGGANKRLLEQLRNPIPFFGFKNCGNQLYEFLGLLEMTRHYTEPQLDSSGILRGVLLFELRIHIELRTVPVKTASLLMEDILRDSSNRLALTESEQTVSAQDTEQKPDDRELVITAEHIRARLLQLHPYRFEQLIKDVLLRSGFVNVQVTRASGDGGIDLIATAGDMHDFFVGTLVQIQAKRWRHAVGSIEINSFRGAMSSTAKGIFISTSYYTRAAFENSCNPQKMCVTLIEGRRLSEIILRTKLDVGGYVD